MDQKKIDRELENHINLEAEELAARGPSAAEVRRRARLALGNTTAIKEAIYEMKNPTSLMEAAMGDLRHALRSVRLNPRYAMTLIAILAVCLGANMAVFSIVYSVLLRPLPVPEADRIVIMANRYPKAGSGETGFSAAGDYYDRMKGMTAVEDHAMFNYTYQLLEGEPASERIRGMVVTPSLFKLLRVAPALGRAFDFAEGEPGAPAVVMLSYGLWQSRYGADPAIIGRQVRMGGRPITVVGVMPANFLFGDTDVRFWAPQIFQMAQRQTHHSNNWWNIGRLRPGATLAQAQSQVGAINRANFETSGQLKELLVNIGFETRVEPLKDYWIRDAKGGLELLWIAALVVLLIGALNAAGLVAARTSVRRREMGTRLALGAGLGRLASQVSAESLVLALAGGTAGLALAYGLASSLARFGLDRFPRAAEVRVDGMTAAFGLAAAIAAGLLMAAFSIAHLARLRVMPALGDFSRSTTAGRHAGVVRKSLVTAQVALAFVLLMGSAVLLASFRELLHVAPGFDTEGVLTAATFAPVVRYQGGPEVVSLVNRSLAELRSLPGVVAAGATNAIPLQTNFNDNVIFPEGYVARTGEAVVSPIQVEATTGYFEAMGIRLLSGRYFNDQDIASSLPVAIVDRQLAERFWPGQNAIGRRVYQPSGADWAKVDANTRFLTVVGVVEQARMKTLLTKGNEAGVYYFAHPQTPVRTVTFAIKTAGDPEQLKTALRTVMKRVDPLLAVFDVQTMSQRTAASLGSRRAALTLTLGFGAVSLLLASIGLYGVLSYLFTLRRREIAVRMAMGCTPGQAFSLFVREGAMLTGAGLVIGGLAAFAGRGIVDKFAYGVKPFDPWVLGLVILTLGAVAFLATAIPARQAARVDPAAALAEQ